MLDADVVEGAHSETLIARLFANPAVDFIHAHFAKHGCFAATLRTTRARCSSTIPGRAFIEQVVPGGRLAHPEEIGELVRLLATAQGSFMTGAIIDFSGGWPAAPARPV